MLKLNDESRHEDLLLKIGIHEGPCLAVTLNDRQDYFGQTVNLSARIADYARQAGVAKIERIEPDAVTAPGRFRAPSPLDEVS